MLLGFVIVMGAYQIAQLFSKKKIDRIQMNEALKAGTE